MNHAGPPRLATSLRDRGAGFSPTSTRPVQVSSAVLGHRASPAHGPAKMRRCSDAAWRGRRTQCGAVRSRPRDGAARGCRRPARGRTSSAHTPRVGRASAQSSSTGRSPAVGADPRRRRRRFARLPQARLDRADRAQHVDAMCVPLLADRMERPRLVHQRVGTPTGRAEVVGGHVGGDPVRGVGSLARRPPATPTHRRHMRLVLQRGPNGGADVPRSSRDHHSHSAQVPRRRARSAQRYGGPAGA
jgi:hypothetical protein